jgi:hypothetical protein
VHSSLAHPSQISTGFSHPWFAAGMNGFGEKGACAAHNKRGTRMRTSKLLYAYSHSAFARQLTRYHTHHILKRRGCSCRLPTCCTPHNSAAVRMVLRKY